MTENTFYQDLLESQKEIEVVDKDGNNPFFKSRYATLGATISACKDILNKHNILCLQPIESDENSVYVCTSLIHTKSDKSLSTKMRIIPAKDNDPQAQGSAITYARRYSLQSLLFMSTEDDDAEKAMSRTPQTPKKAVSPNQPTMTATCEDCGEPMQFKEGDKEILKEGKKIMKHWSGYFCSKEPRTHKPLWL